LRVPNNESNVAFVRERLAGLELLASQAAMSLKIARPCVGLRHETSERRKAEEELKRIRRMYGEAHLAARTELMGGLAAALTHELNQPLGAIQSNAQAARRLLGSENPDLEEVKAAVEDIIRDNSRAADTVRNVRAIFQRDAAEMSSLDLLELLDDVCRIERSRRGTQGDRCAPQPARFPPYRDRQQGSAYSGINESSS
jgi:C4-dicarboxylate-specific signal transduction histidine kinase